MKLQQSIRRSFAVGMFFSGATLFGTACSGDSTSPGTNTATPHVTASVGGSDWKANYLVDVAIGDRYDDSHRIDVIGLEISPTYSGREVTFVLGNFTGVGTYTLGEQSTGTWGYYVTSADVRTHDQEVTYKTQQAGAGTVTVTSFDIITGQIEGTFNVDVALPSDPTNTVHIAGGSFKGYLAPGA